MSKTPTPLIEAIVNKDYNLVKKLLENKADPNQTGPLDTSPLIYAGKFNSADIVKTLIEYGADIDYVIPNSIGDSVNALMQAARSNSLVSSEILLENQANIEIIQPDNGMTPLMVAAKYNSYDVCKLLLDNNANIEAKAYGLYEKRTPLCFAVLNESYETTELLLKYHANPKNLKVVRKKIPPKMVKWLKSRKFI